MAQPFANIQGNGVPPVSFRSYPRRLAFAVLCWSGVVLLESSQVFVADATRGYLMGPAHYLVWSILNWFVLALLTPMIYDLGRRYPLTGPNWVTRMIGPHALVCAVCIVLQAVGRGLAGWVYTLNHELPASPLALTGEWIDKRGLLGLIAYWIIVVAATFAQLREEMRQRELRHAQLEASLASAELEKLRMQIQPHFLFNTMQAAITLVQEDPQAAEDVLLRLSELLRISLDQMQDNEIPLARELEFLDLYVGIQLQRFGSRLTVEIHADSAVLEEAVPPLILQPLVENAIRHGIGKHKGDDRVEVFVRRLEYALQIEVWNSNSVLEEAHGPVFGRGVGLRNTQARLEHIYGPGTWLNLRPLARGGAVATIIVPVRAGTARPAMQAAVRAAV
jgi:hypothetical protein